MICMGLAALFYYQGKAANQSRKKINFKMMTHDSNELFPAPHQSDFTSGSRKLTKVISINSNEKDIKLGNLSHTDNAAKNEYQLYRNYASEYE